MDKKVKSLIAIILMIEVAFFAGCKPEEDTNNNNGNQPNDTITVPKVVTSAVFDITETQAVGGGEVIDDGGLVIVERGLCWSTAISPDVSGDHAFDSLGLGTFSWVMTDLLPDTTYYVRAYAINGKGIGYGEQVSFRTLASSAPVIENYFVGKWGVERVDYYSIDYYGNPIPNTIETYYFTPGDPDNGIEMVYREDQTGEMRDSSKDSLYVDGVFVLCPDTTIVTPYTYTYSENDSILYMYMQSIHPVSYQMIITIMNDDYFIFVNEYQSNYIEKAYLRRLSYVPDKPSSSNRTVSDYPTKKGPLFRK